MTSVMLRQAHSQGFLAHLQQNLSNSVCEAILLFAKELPHASLPPAALVQGDSSVLGAAPREPGALPAQDVHELLLGEALHLVNQRWHVKFSCTKFTTMFA